MPDPTHLYAPKTCTEPTQVCEKCRNLYTLDAFQHGVEGQACVCRRCLQALGYETRGPVAGVNEAGVNEAKG